MAITIPCSESILPRSPLPMARVMVTSEPLLYRPMAPLTRKRQILGLIISGAITIPLFALAPIPTPSPIKAIVNKLGHYGGQLKIVSIPEDGSEVKVLSQWTFDHGSSAYGDWNSLVKVDYNTFALAYSGGSSDDGTIKTFTISDEGSSITEVAVLVHDTGIGHYNSIVNVKDNTFALAYTGTGNDGYIKTFTIPNDGSTITQVQSLEHDTDNAQYNSLVKLDPNTTDKTLVLSYTGSGSDGYIKTFTIPADGSTITQVQSLEHDTDNSAWNSLTKDKCEHGCPGLPRQGFGWLYKNLYDTCRWVHHHTGN